MTLVLNGTTGVSSVDGSASTPAIQGTDSNTGVFFPAADTVAIATGGSERLRADSSGNLGIGTSSPSYKLDVSGSPAGQPLVRVQNSASHEATIRYTTAHSSSSDYKVGASITVANAFEIYSVAAGASRAIIDSSGNLLVGTTSAGYTSSRFVLSLDNSTKWVTGPGAGIATRFYVSADTNGGVYLSSTSATSWTAISDERHKTDLVPIADGLNKVCSLRAVTGRLTTDAPGTSKAFLIAQDVLSVLPEAVDTSDPDRYGLSYTDTIPLLVAAIQEQQALIESLTARIAALEGAQA